MMHTNRNSSPRKDDHPNVPRFLLAPEYEAPRLIIGCWQLAGGHGEISDGEAFTFLEEALRRGFTAFDCADIYSGVEDRLGRFLEYLRARDPTLAARAQVHTKFVPDLEAIHAGVVDEHYVRAICERSLNRLRVERLDLVQFHWWDFEAPGMIDAARGLVNLQREGKIGHIGVTNFDAKHLDLLMCEGIRVVSNQVQYSLLDQRPEHTLREYAQRHNIALLAYGTVAGGLLSERFLNSPEPDFTENRSLTKYGLMIRERGGWDAFQRLLSRLARLSVDNDLDIASLATRYILDQPGVGGVIIGTRSGSHLASHERLVTQALSTDVREAVHAAIGELFPLLGDIYDLERNRDGAHGRIMRYNLNEGSGPG